MPRSPPSESQATSIGIHKPVSSAILNIIRVVILLIPLTLLGSKIFDLSRVFGGRLITDGAAGSIGIMWTGRVLAKEPLR